MYIHSDNMGKGFILLAICPNNNYSNSDQKCAIYEVCPIHNVLSILSRSQCWPSSSRHFVYIVDLLSCLHRPHRNVHRHRVDIVFFLSCFIDNIVEIAILTDIESISCIFFHVYIVNIAMLFDIVSTSYPFCDVTNVNSISVQHRIHCHVDDVNVKEMSAKSTV